MEKIRTRYAPSPTGYLHIGGARTALFAYLYAKHFKGEFIVRIEDTDQARHIKDGEASQLDNLAWLGIIPDESPLKPNAKYGPYRQSEKIKHYQELVKQLVKEQKAYKAYDTAEELEKQKAEQALKGQFSFRYDPNWLQIDQSEKQKRDQNKQFVIRLKLKHNHIYKWNDLVRGPIEVNTNDIGDWVIQKQDGFPTYNFANVIDDHEMAISDVLRGEEHITNTPKQLAVYEAFNWKAPRFGHLTIITNMEGKKLSKRDTLLKQFIADYKKDGFLPEAIFNFLALLGWSHPESKEKLSHQELIASFDPNRLSKSPSKFDINKMRWFAKAYMKEQDNQFLESHLKFKRDQKWMTLFLDTYKEGATTFTDLQNALDLYQDQSVKPLKPTEVVKTFAKQLKKEAFTVLNIEKAIKETQKITNQKGKNLFMPIRQATTYQEHGPELAKAIFLVGEELIFKRLKSCF